MQVCPVSIRVLGEALQVRALRGEHLDWAVTEQLTVALEVDSPHERGVPVRWSVHLRGSLRRPERGRRANSSAGDGPLLFVPRTIHGWAAVDGAAADGR